jgi:hypothetical protein
MLAYYDNKHTKHTYSKAAAYINTQHNKERDFASLIYHAIGNKKKKKNPKPKSVNFCRSTIFENYALHIAA